MSRQAITRPSLAALALALLLAGSAAATAAPRRAGRAAHPAATAALAGSPLAAAWRWWAGLSSPALTTMRGGQGSAVDPNGKPATAGALPGYSLVNGDEGSAVDPDGHH